MKVKVVVEYLIDIPVTANEAARAYPDCLWPKEALALDKISDIGLEKLIKGSTAEVKDVIVDD